MYYRCHEYEDVDIMMDNPMLKQFASLLEKAAALREQMSELLSEQHLSPWWQDCTALHHVLLKTEQALIGQLKQGTFHKQIENRRSWRQVEELLEKAETLRSQMSAQLPDVQFATWLHEGAALNHNLAKAEQTFVGQLKLESFRVFFTTDTYVYTGCERGTIPLMKQMVDWLDHEIPNTEFFVNNNQLKRLQEHCDGIEWKLDILRKRLAVDGPLEQLLTCADQIGRLSKDSVRGLAKILGSGRQSVDCIAALNQSVRDLALKPQQERLRIVSKLGKEFNRLKNDCIDNNLLQRFYKEIFP